MEDIKSFSMEFQKVLKYMNDVLYFEFPTNELTVEYLIVAMLDNKKCHANLLLDNCLMSHNINELKKIYINFLKDNINNNINKNNKDIKYNIELTNIIENAKKERENLYSTLIGSEHILLSLLNPENNCYKILDVFRNMGIDYEFILNKCNENKKENENKISKKPQKLLNEPFKLKSEINAKALTNNKSNYISQYTTSINQLVSEGKIDPLIGRTTEVELITKILSRRKKNNVVLVGKGGCGKTAIVQGLAATIVNGTAPSILKDKEIVQLNVMALISGTHFRGMFEERVNGLFDELKSNKNYILFLDDIQQVLKNGSKDRDADISQMVGEILTDGDVRIIATTTFKDYRNSIEPNTSLSRKLQKVVIEPASVNDTIEILNQNKKYYEEYHNVSYSSDVIKKAVELSERYISDRSLPDSAIDVIDLSGAYTCLINREPEDIILLKKRLSEINIEKENKLNHGDFEAIDALSEEENMLKSSLADFTRKYETNSDEYKIEITVDDIAKSISDMTNIPINKLSSNEKTKIANIENILKESIVGQDEAIEKICKIIKRNRVGLGDKTKTQGNVLMLGPSGVGKTLIAKKLAEEIFGSPSDLVRIDMSEYSEKNSVAKLTGAAPGYVGFENGGQLTEAIKNKQHCVLLLDEIEKADQEVYNLFLQLFDEGRLTDSSGQIVNFKNVIVLMTSNIGAKQADEMGKGVGFITNENENKKSIIEKTLKSTFTPEFINRIDQIVYFNSLTDDNLKNIVTLELNKFSTRLQSLGFNITWNEDVINFIQALALKQKNLGARPIIRIIQDNIEDKVTDLMLQNEYENGYVFYSRVEENNIIVR